MANNATFLPGPRTKRGKPAKYYIDLEMSAYKCLYDLAFNKVTAIYFVYQIRKYDGAGPEHNYLISCVSGNNYYGLCFVKDEWGEYFMPIWGIQGKKLSYYKYIRDATLPAKAGIPPFFKFLLTFPAFSKFSQLNGQKLCCTCA